MSEQSIVDASFRSAFERTPHPHLIVDQTGAILLANPAMERTFWCARPASCNLDSHGCRPCEACGRRIDDLLPDESAFFDAGVYTGEYARMRHAIAEYLRDAGTDDLDLETLNWRSSGGHFQARMSWRRIHDPRMENGDGSRILLAITDMSREVEQDRRTRYEIYQTITELAEARDNETGLHIRRIGEYSAMLSAVIGMPAAYTESMRRFAPLHDIGKVGVPDAILLAPRKLTRDEFETMKRHTTLGHSILDGKPTMELAAEIAWSHHEWYDGSGYPRGQVGGAIPISARIVAVADVYDALCSRRPYKEPWTHEAAMEHITDASGSHFCPMVVEALRTAEDQIRACAEELAG